MSGTRKLLIHIVLLAVATVGAIAVWTRDKQPTEKRTQSDVEVWSGTKENVQRISYDSKKRNVVLEAKKDDVGIWFEGKAEREQAPRRKPDAGPSDPKPEPKRVTTEIVSVKAAERIVEKIAPLRAVRNLGTLPADRLEEFGLKEPKATLVVVIGGKEHKMDLGETAPGGRDRYARKPSTGEVFALDATFLRDLESGEAALNERELHGFEEDEIAGIKITAADKSRELVSGGTGKKRFWADPSAPDTADQTAGTWMTKVKRLRPREFVAGKPEGASPVLKIEYRGKSGPIGFVELVKVPKPDAEPEPGKAKADYFLRTERTRRFAKIHASIAEQVEKDVESLMK